MRYGKLLSHAITTHKSSALVGTKTYESESGPYQKEVVLLLRAKYSNVCRNLKEGWEEKIPNADKLKVIYKEPRRGHVVSCDYVWKDTYSPQRVLGSTSQVESSDVPKGFYLPLPYRRKSKARPARKAEESKARPARKAEESKARPARKPKGHRVGVATFADAVEASPAPAPIITSMVVEGVEYELLPPKQKRA
jgi:hypothetical protein